MIASAEPSAEERETARTLLISGREKRKAGDMTGALADFYRAHSMMHVPTTGLDLGKAQADLGMLVEARNTFLDVAKIPVKPKESAAFGRAREEAKRLAEAIAPRLGTVTVTVKGVPARAKVIISVDGADNSSATRGVPFKVNPGKREIAASSGEVRDSKRVEIPEGGTQAIELTLGTGTGTGAGGGAGADVDLDAQGEPKTTKPEKPEPIEEKQLDDATPPHPTEPPRTSTNPLVWIGLATTGIGVAVGTITGINSMSIYSAIEPRCPKGLCPPNTHSDLDNGVALSAVSTTAFIVAGVGAAVTVYGLLSPRKEKAKRTGLVVLPVGVAGTF